MLCGKQTIQLHTHGSKLLLTELTPCLPKVDIAHQKVVMFYSAYGQLFLGGDNSSKLNITLPFGLSNLPFHLIF